MLYTIYLYYIYIINGLYVHVYASYYYKGYTILVFINRNERVVASIVRNNWQAADFIFFKSTNSQLSECQEISFKATSIFFSMYLMTKFSYFYIIAYWYNYHECLPTSNSVKHSMRSDRINDFYCRCYRYFNSTLLST